MNAAIDPSDRTGGAQVRPVNLENVPPALRGLASALGRLRTALGAVAYPLALPSADEAQRVGSALIAQLDDYLLPRLSRPDAPLLVVVGGSTGAGKSTLVNSLVQAPVSSAGVLRPTTRSPVLVTHPDDLAWYSRGELLPGLTRTGQASTAPDALQVVATPAIGPGLALLDAPDIDSVVDHNRKLAAQLLAAADLWLFVTTAARYADAVPWELLTTARLRGTVIALVLDRVPGDAAAEIAAHLGEMLTAKDLGSAPLFVLPETDLDERGLLPEAAIGPMRIWFAQLAADAGARSTVVRQTLDGALAALAPALAGLAEAVDDQARTAQALDERVEAAYRTARRTVEDGLRDGRLLRGEVLARWQEFVGTGDLVRGLESRVGQLRDRLVAALSGRPTPARNLQTAMESQLVTLLRGVAADAAEQSYSAWQAHPAGAALLEPELQRASADLAQRADRLVRDWQQWVLELVRKEAAEKRTVARGAAYAMNGAGLAVMIAVFTSTAFIPTGLEVAAGAGSAVAAQKVLEAIFGDQAIRTLATRARTDLLARVEDLLATEAARYTDRTSAVRLTTAHGTLLRQTATEVETAREELALTGSGS
ncbi:ABC transporter [Actinoplanes utahensis]|nr:ABC transporter [Actinoplanes utahensis]